MRLVLPACFALATLARLAAADPAPGADSQRQDGVPQGQVLKQPTFKSQVFAGTEREWSVYVPKQYDAAKPTAVMVFQDGSAYLGGDFKTPIVFDNLIHQGALPPVIGIFINPGVKPDDKAGAKKQRSIEYDTLSDDYARFLLDEILPEAGKRWNLSKDRKDRAIGGLSSGAICAWTVAWQRPGEFSKVLSHIGSYTSIRGGNAYPDLIRKEARKPIRIFLQDGTGDLKNQFGSWWEANQAMAAALAEKGYDHKTAWGEGGHNGKHGGAILPESLKWLWRAEGAE